MTGKIKTVAVVGLGHGITHLREGYGPNGDLFKVLALCDLNTERLTQAAQDYKVERITTSFDELLTMPDLDIIDICTPPSLHRDQVISALEAGKHVVCEKPLVGSLADVDDVIAVEARAKGVLMPIFQCRFGDGIGQVKAILDAGLAGKPYVASVETLWTRTPEYYAVPWRGKWATELGGVLATHAIHAHDLLTYLLGPIARVFGRIDTRVNAIEVEDCVSASLLMENGALVSLSATLGSQQQITRLRLAFENVTFESSHDPYQPGTALWQIIPAADEAMARVDACLAEHWVPGPATFRAQMARFHRALTDNTALPVTSADARRSIELLTAIYHSSETRSDINLPIGPDHPKYRGWQVDAGR